MFLSPPDFHSCIFLEMTAQPLEAWEPVGSMGTLQTSLAYLVNSLTGGFSGTEFNTLEVYDWSRAEGTTQNLLSKSTRLQSPPNERIRKQPCFRLFDQKVYRTTFMSPLKRTLRVPKSFRKRVQSACFDQVCAKATNWTNLSPR